METALGQVGGLRIRAINKLAGLLAAAAGSFSSSHAVAEDCGPYIANMFSSISAATAAFYGVQAVRITARGRAGFSSFSMSPSYSPSMGISTSPLSTPQFYLELDRTTGRLAGQFQDVFPGRRDGSSDLTTLSILPSNAVQFRLDDWGGSVVALSRLQCFPGHAGAAFVMTGQHHTTGYGLDTWTFLIVPYLL